MRSATKIACEYDMYEIIIKTKKKYIALRFFSDVYSSIRIRVENAKIYIRELK